VGLENLSRWTNDGSKSPHQYDWAVDGIPFLSAASKEYPYIRESIEERKQQIDTTAEAGEQSLQNWWYRSQSSFDLGAGIIFNDTVKNDNISRRFFDSCGVDSLTTPGETKLQNKMLLRSNDSATNLRTITYAVTGSTGYIYSAGSVLRYQNLNNSNSGTVNYGASEPILSIDSDGSRYFVLTTKGVYAGALPNGVGVKVLDLDANQNGTTTDINTGVIKFAKERLIVAIRKGSTSFLYQTAITPSTDTNFLRPSRIQWQPVSGSIPAGNVYEFDETFNWSIGQGIVKVEDSRVNEFNFNTLKSIVAVSGDNRSFRIAQPTFPTPQNATDTSRVAKVFTSVANVPIEIYKTTTSFFNWTAIADGPSGIYFSGNSGDKSSIMFSTIRATQFNNIPQIQPPYTVAELPPGEIVLSLASYLSVYLIVGTSKGVRVAIITGDGSLVLGPLLFTADKPVQSLAVSGEFCYAGGAESVEANGTKRTGIYKINLSKSVEDNSLIFAYQKSYYADGIVSSTTNNITAIARVESFNFTIFAASGSGIYQEIPAVVDNGWLETGKIRLDTSEDKIFQYLRVNNLPTDGFVSVFWRDETNALSTTPINRWYGAAYTGTAIPNTLTDAEGIKAVDMEGTIPVDGETRPHPFVSYRFVLEKGLLNFSPTLQSYQVKANPANIKQFSFRLPLLLLNREKATNGLVVERSIFDRLRVIEKAAQTGKVVLFQDFGTGEERLIIIERVQFISNHIPESKAAAEKGGVLLLTIRTVDPVNLTGSTIG